MVDGANSVPKYSAVPDRSRTVNVREKLTSKRYSVLAGRSCSLVTDEVGKLRVSVGGADRLRPGRDNMMVKADRIRGA